MLETITKIVNSFNQYASQNQVIAGAISLWGLSVLSYFGRNIPNKIWQFIKKQSTTKLTLISTHEAFYSFLKWLINNGYTKKIRSLKITNGKWGDKEKAIQSIGYGTHFFLYKFRPFMIDLNQMDSNASNMEKDQLTITILGRKHKFFEKIFKEIQEESLHSDKILVNKYIDNWWQTAQDQYKRSINSVFIDNNTKQTIVNHIQKFIDSEDWYKKNGISYQTGILLYGKPGTGKTSLIKAIASHFNKNLYILSASELLKIENAMMRLPEKSIIVIEDIDTDISTLKRENDDENKPKVTDANKPKVIDANKTKLEPIINFSFSNLSDILNSIDGLITCNGRILIATTNHKERLSRALLRDGRFDLKLELINVNIEILKQFFNNFYPDFIFNENIKIKNNISPAKLQNLIMKNLNNPEYVIKKIIE